MKAWKNVLCPIDFSPPSGHALDLAARLAADFGAQLTVLHALDTHLSLGSLVPIAGVVTEARGLAEAEMARVRQSLGAARFELLEGNPYRVILNWTEEQDIDLLVMGTHGLSGIERLILGSVVEKVLHRVDVPLLTVSPEVRGRRPLEEALWRKLMLATDFGPACREVADHALSLARRYQASLLVVHVLPLPEESEGPGSQGVAHDDWARIAAQLRKERERKLEELVPDSELPAGRIERLLLTGFPGPTLARLARERDVDLVVQGGHGHGKHDLGWIGSTAHHLIRAAAAPVLTIRIKKEEGS